MNKWKRSENLNGGNNDSALKRAERWCCASHLRNVLITHSHESRVDLMQVLLLASSFVQRLLGISNTHRLQEMGEIFTVHSQWCQIRQYHNNLKALKTAIRLVLQSGLCVLIAFYKKFQKQKAIESVNSTHFWESVQLSLIQWFVCGTTMLKKLKHIVNIFYLWRKVLIYLCINYNLI